MPQDTDGEPEGARSSAAASACGPPAPSAGLTEPPITPPLGFEDLCADLAGETWGCLLYTSDAADDM
eukprot:3343181-Alexandrium_andersonii.AAC.1